MIKMTVEDEYGKYTIEQKDFEGEMEKFVSVVKSMALAMSFAESTVEKFLGKA